MKGLYKKLIYYSILGVIIFINACNKDNSVDEPCDFDFNAWCNGGYSFSIVNYDTYENLVGEGKLIDPTKIVITNTRGDTMQSRPNLFSDGWYTIERFNPFDEITCFDQCKSDSAFTRTYFLNYGGEDTDTMEVFFAARDDDPQVSFNGLPGDVPVDRHDSTGLGYSLYWFRKKID
jgi:hypothetical protein